MYKEVSLNDVVRSMLSKYEMTTLNDEENALKEIIQEIALLGLWRSKFFEKAAFYGGSALRILYGLNRFSEDLDFSLLKKDLLFDIKTYEKAIIDELTSFNFDVEIETKPDKKKISDIQSAFLKANTMVHLLKINSKFKTHKNAILKIKLEVDTNPPPDFVINVEQHFRPIPFSIKTFNIESLFAGKVHACLCRSERVNIKGRDWYDFLWYISRDTRLNLTHLKMRMVQTKDASINDSFTIGTVRELFNKKINSLDIDRAKRDVMPFVKNPSDLDAWSKDLFLKAAERIRI